MNHLLFGAPGEVGCLEMAVQLNFPKESYDRSYAGAFVRDTSGAIFFAHRGKLTKGKAGLRKSLVLSQFSTCIEARDGNQMSRMILIADLEQPDMIDKLFAFAQEARDVATRIAAGGVVESGSEEKGGRLDAEELQAFTREACNNEIQRSAILQQAVEARGIELPFEVGNTTSTRNWLASLV